MAWFANSQHALNYYIVTFRWRVVATRSFTPRGTRVNFNSSALVVTTCVSTRVPRRSRPRTSCRRMRSPSSCWTCSPSRKRHRNVPWGTMCEHTSNAPPVRFDFRATRTLFRSGNAIDTISASGSGPSKPVVVTARLPARCASRLPRWH